MKKILLIVAVAAIGMVSCKKEESVQPSKASKTMHDTGKTNMGTWD